MSAIHCGISCFSGSADFGFWADRQRVEARRARVIFFHREKDFFEKPREVKLPRQY
jgi:hypothetical protein